MLATLLIFAAEGTGQGGQPDTGPGILLIIGIAVLIALVFAALVWLITSRNRKARGQDAGRDEGSHPSGRVGRL